MIKRALAGLALACVAQASAAQYPAKPIRLIVGFAAGGAVDVAARIVARRLAENVGQSIVIDNRPGAGGIVAMGELVRAPADGYTIHLASSGTLVITPHAQSNLPYDVGRDIASLTLAVTFSNILVIHPGIPARTLAEYLEYARRNPGKATFASSGIGSIGHLAGELLRLRANAPLVHVAYRGGAPAMNDLLGGQVGAMIATIPTALPHVRAGKLRALGLTSLTRADSLPDIPTIAEQGFAGFDATNWYAFVGSARLAPELVTRLNTELVRALGSPEVREQLLANGMEPIPSSAEAMVRHMQAESAVWAKVVKDASIKLE